MQAGKSGFPPVVSPGRLRGSGFVSPPCAFPAPFPGRLMELRVKTFREIVGIMESAEEGDFGNGAVACFQHRAGGIHAQSGEILQRRLLCDRLKGSQKRVDRHACDSCHPFQGPVLLKGCFQRAEKSRKARDGVAAAARIVQGTRRGANAPESASAPAIRFSLR